MRVKTKNVSHVTKRYSTKCFLNIAEKTASKVSRSLIALAFFSLSHGHSSLASTAKSQRHESPHSAAAIELMRARNENPRIRQLDTLARKTYHQKLQRLRSSKEYLEQKIINLNKNIASLKETKALASYAEARSSHGFVAFVDLGDIDVSPLIGRPKLIKLYLSPELKVVAKDPGSDNYLDLFTYYFRKDVNNLHLHQRQLSPKNIGQRIQETYKKQQNGDIEIHKGLLSDGRNEIRYKSEEKMVSEILDSMDSESKPLNAAKELQRARKAAPKSRELGTIERQLYKAQLAKVRFSDTILDASEQWLYQRLHSMAEFKDLLEYMTLLDYDKKPLELGIPHEEIRELLSKEPKGKIPKQIYNQILRHLYRHKKIFFLEHDGTITLGKTEDYETNELVLRDFLGFIPRKELLAILKSEILMRYDGALRDDIK